MSPQKPSHRFISIGPLVIKIESTIPIRDALLHPAIREFEIPCPEKWDVTLFFHFGIPEEIHDPGEFLGMHQTWALFEKSSGEMTFIDVSPDQSYSFLPNTEFFRESVGNSKVYEVQTTPQLGEKKTLCNLVFHPESNRFDYFIPDDKWRLYEKDGNLFDSTLLQIILTHCLHKKNGLLIHAAGLAIDDRGMAFVGHSGAGKSTISSLILDHSPRKAQMLCDDRIVI